MKCSRCFVVVALVVAAMLSFTTLAVAQRGVERRAAFASAAKSSTSIAGVEVFGAVPKGFNPLTATNQELWKYGLPEAPNKTTDPVGYALWAKGMAALKTHATDVKALPFSSRNLMSAGKVAPQIDGGTISTTSYNWSGLANTNTLKKWSAKKSFDYVASWASVPTAFPPFSAPCADGPWYDATWNGVDGFDNGDVVQGGSLSISDGGACGGGVLYVGWVEWYPSYSILAIDCGSSYCPVNPGDLIEVVTEAYPGTDEQYVFIEDFEQEWYGTFGLTYQSGPGVVGSSAEYIVERPCCNGNGYPLPLDNYLLQSFYYGYAYDTAGTEFFPGKANYAITMLADDGSTDISFPISYGSSGSAEYSFVMENENCSYDGGCTP